MCRHYIITGKVQGVFFRASTQQEAVRQGLNGWVRNCENGDVEALACGDPTSLDVFQRWLEHGPPLAQVQSVMCDAPVCVAPTTFEVL